MEFDDYGFDIPEDMAKQSAEDAFNIVMGVDKYIEENFKDIDMVTRIGALAVLMGNLIRMARSMGSPMDLMGLMELIDAHTKTDDPDAEQIERDYL